MLYMLLKISVDILKATEHKCLGTHWDGKKQYKTPNVLNYIRGHFLFS